jgi:hypothetical protein
MWELIEPHVRSAKSIRFHPNRQPTAAPTGCNELLIHLEEGEERQLPDRDIPKNFALTRTGKLAVVDRLAQNFDCDLGKVEAD